jgi:hypothetical protein
MCSRPKRLVVFEGPESDHERAKSLNAKGKRRSAKRKQKISLTVKTKGQFRARSRRVDEQTQSEQKVRPRRKQKQPVVKAIESKRGDYDKPRRSARLEEQGSKIL